MASPSVQPRPDGSYTFTSSPRVVNNSNKKYREKKFLSEDEEDDSQSVNIMYDRRVIRGNTYALQRSLAALQSEVAKQLAADERSQEKLRRLRELTKTHQSKQLVNAVGTGDLQAIAESGTQEPVLEKIPGNSHDLLFERGWHDPTVPRPLSPPYVRGTETKESGTQVRENELFHFESEVVPVLEMLVGRVIEKSLLEVQEEDELAVMREQRHAFEELRNAELAEKQRLEEQHRRLEEEKQRRHAQHAKTSEDQKVLAEKLAALVFAKSYMAQLVPAVFGTLNATGYFYDPVEREVERFFVPWLMDATVDRVSQALTTRMALDSIIRQAVQERARVNELSLQRRDEYKRGVPRKKPEQTPQAPQEGSSSSADAARGEKPASESGDESAAGRAAAMQREKSNVLDTVLEEPEDSTAAAAAMAAAGGALEGTPIAEGEQEAAALEPPVPAEQTDAGEVPQGDESAAVASGEEAPAGVPEDQPAPDAAASNDAQ